MACRASVKPAAVPVILTLSVAAGDSTRLSTDLNVVIPEPYSISLALGGLVGLFALRRYKH